MPVQEQYTVGGSSRREIAASVEAGIEDGTLPPGARLPAVRRLADQLSVSPATVAAAYADLRSRGVITSQERRGVRVAHRPALATHLQPGALPDGVVDLTRGNPDPALLPLLPALRPHRSRLYGDTGAVPALLDIVGDGLEADGVATGHLAVTSGALDGIDRVLDVHLRPGDRIAVEDPCWTGTRDLLRLRGLDTVGVGVDGLGMTPDALARALDAGAAAVLITPRAHNPTGAALDAGRTDDLRAVLDARPDVVVIEDDHSGVVSGVGYHTLTAGRSRWAVVRSMAKMLGPDLRVAVLAGDRHTVARVDGRQRLGPGWVSTILQRIVVVLLTDPETTDLLAHAADVYTRRRDSLVAALDGVGIASSARSGFNVWVPVAQEAPLVAGLERAGWGVRAGEAFRLAAGPALRITSSALPPSAARRLAADLASLTSDRPATRLG